MEAHNNNRSFIKKYYIDNSSTLLLPLFFGTLSIVIVLQQFPAFSIKGLILENGFKAFITLNMAIYPVLLGAMCGFYCLLKYFIDKKEKEKKRDTSNMSIILDSYKEYKDIMIPRPRQYKKITEFLNKTFEHKKYAFIVGKSGNGKSLLLSEFKCKHNENSILFSTNNENSENDYADPTKLGERIKEIIDTQKKETSYYYLIFDQFEKVLLQWESFKIIFDLLLNDLRKEDLKDIPIRFIFACRKDKYGDVFEELQGNINDQTDAFFLYVDEEEKQDMLTYIEDKLKLSKGDKHYRFFKDLLEGLCSGVVSMIEVNIAINYFENAKLTEIDEMFKKNLYPQKEIIKAVFEKSFLLTELDLGMIIIYSLCCENYAYGLTLHDFQNLTFAPKETIKEILKSLEEQRIVKEVKNVDYVKLSYVVAHDYLIENLKEHCKNNLYEKIILNIDFYCREKKDRESREIKEEKEEKLNLLESPLSKYYKKTVEEKSDNFVTRCIMWSLCLAVLAVCVWQEINGYHSIFFSYMEFDRNHYIFAFTVLAVGIAMFYAYHYLYHFTKIFLFDKGSTKFWCILYIILGMLSAILALLANEFWVTGLAIAWLVNAILHFNLSKKISSNENIRNRLKADGIMYLIVAFGLIGLNIWVMIINRSAMSSVMYPWFGVFILFVFGAIRQHLNTDWILSKVGCFTGLCLKEDTFTVKNNGGVE